jgi:hypothetical protein
MSAGKSNGAGGVTVYAANMQRMASLLSDLYTPIETDQWLQAKHDLLGGQTPAQLIADGRAAEVEDLISAIKDGVFL